MIALIAAINNNYVIGNNGALPWKLRSDLERFKELTTGKTVVMGRKTYESLPVKPLPDRVNIVLTRGEFDAPDDTYVYNSTTELMSSYESAGDDAGEVFVIGGAEIYEQFMPLADKIHLTLVEDYSDGDAKFPQIDFTKWNVYYHGYVGESETDEKHHSYWELVRKGEKQ